MQDGEELDIRLVPATSNPGLLNITAGTLPEPLPEKENIPSTRKRTRRCGACGEKGHIRTNKACPEYSKPQKLEDSLSLHPSSEFWDSDSDDQQFSEEIDWTEEEKLRKYQEIVDDTPLCTGVGTYGEDGMLLGVCENPINVEDEEDEVCFSSSSSEEEEEPIQVPDESPLRDPPTPLSPPRARKEDEEEYGSAYHELVMAQRAAERTLGMDFGTGDVPIIETFCDSVVDSSFTTPPRANDSVAIVWNPRTGLLTPDRTSSRGRPAPIPRSLHESLSEAQEREDFRRQVESVGERIKEAVQRADRGVGLSIESLFGNTGHSSWRERAREERAARTPVSTARERRIPASYNDRSPRREPRDLGCSPPRRRFTPPTISLPTDDTRSTSGEDGGSRRPMITITGFAPPTISARRPTRSTKRKGTNTPIVIPAKRRTLAKGVEGAEEEDADLICVICLTERKNRFLVPCGHVCMCAECCDMLIARAAVPYTPCAKCPLCRTDIEGVSEAFI